VFGRKSSPEVVQIWPFVNKGLKWLLSLYDPRLRTQSLTESISSNEHLYVIIRCEVAMEGMLRGDLQRVEGCDLNSELLELLSDIGSVQKRLVE